MKTPIISVTNLSIERQNKQILKNISFTLNNGEQLFLTGNSGAGKTSLGMALAGKLYHSGLVEFAPTLENSLPKISFVSQLYTFNNKTRTNDFYYQQRYNSYDSTDSATVREVLLEKLGAVELSEQVTFLLNQLALLHRLDAPLVQLSSGERKKIQLIEALSILSDIFILDNPYIGLDKVAVDNLNQYLSELADRGLTIIIIGDNVAIPEFVTHVATLNNGEDISIVPANKYIRPVESVMLDLHAIHLEPVSFDFNSIIEFVDVTVDYAGKQVLHNIDWKVIQGDKWLLQGHNGAGKSTLLSLIYGDHPQSYANEIYLFGKKRGSGESVWDIKKNIGFISPELHWYFNPGITCLDTIISGFFDTPGIYSKLKPEHIKLATEWLERLDLISHKNSTFSQVSPGIQRVVLLARALVKNPPLFIFDEPCQGLDDVRSQQFIQIIDTLFADKERTMIYVSHRPDQIPQCINNKIVLENGYRIV